MKVHLRPHWENEVKCVINGFKGSLLVGFDDVPVLIVKCCVYYHSLGPYIPFIFLIGYFPDTLKIKEYNLYFKKNMQSVMECVVCCAKNI